MKKANCDLSDIALCMMAVSVLGLLGTAAILAARAAKKHCKDNMECTEEDDEQNEE